MFELIGFFKEHRGDKFPSLFEVVDTQSTPTDFDKKVSNYLKNGILIYTLRTFFICPVTKEIMTGPAIYTDGVWLWTSELIFYCERYKVKIPTAFLGHIKSNEFEITIEFDRQKIENLNVEIMNWLNS